MGNNVSNVFSPFKLFYDNFVDNLYEGIDYSDIIYDINKIKKIVWKFNIGVYDNINVYTNKLKRVYLRIKYILDDIQLKNEDVFGEYYDLYLRKVDEFKDKDDMVFVIANSFYNENRVENLVKNNTNILNKEQVKKAKEYFHGTDVFDAFISLLEESKNKKQYFKFLEKVKDYKNFKPFVKEDKFEYFKRLDNFLNRVGSLSIKLQEKAIKNGDYLYINSVLNVLGLEDSIWGINIKYYLNNYYSVKYEEFNDNNTVLRYVNLVNDLSYETYLDKIREYEKEKDHYDKLFYTNKLKYIALKDDCTSKFREVIMNNYYDKRYMKVIYNNLNDYVSRAIELYDLAKDLEKMIFEKEIYDASHSMDLKRNNNVMNALVDVVYGLYNPKNLLELYDKIVVDFEKSVALLSKDERYEYNKKLIEEKIKYDYHGSIPKSSYININVIERKKDFLYDNILTDLVSLDITRRYDTRNYDLFMVVQGIEIEELVILYDKLRYKVSKCNKYLLKDLQEFVCKYIISVKYTKKFTVAEYNNRIKDICFTYLKEEPLFSVSNKKEIVNNDEEYIKNEFKKNAMEFRKNSNWLSLLDKYDIKVING